jgi:hypothetical protein
MTPNDIRARESRSRIEDGDRFFRPGNWLSLGREAPAPAAPAQAPTATRNAPREESENRRLTIGIPSSSLQADR